MPNSNKRSKIAQGAFSRARGVDMEDIVYEDLADYFHEVFVHVQSRKRKVNFDYVIYAKNSTFAVDIYFSEKQVNMLREAKKKIKTYAAFGQTVYIVQVNARLNGNIERLSNLAKSNIGVFDYDDFIADIKSRFKPLTPPKGYKQFNQADLLLTKRISDVTSQD